SAPISSSRWRSSRRMPARTTASGSMPFSVHSIARLHTPASSQSGAPCPSPPSTKRGAKRITRRRCDPIDAALRTTAMNHPRPLGAPRPSLLRTPPAGLSLVSAHRNGAAMPSGDELIELIRAVAQTRDRSAFAVLFKHFAPRVKAYLVRAGTLSELAEELAQETMVTVWRKAVS